MVQTLDCTAETWTGTAAKLAETTWLINHHDVYSTLAVAVVQGSRTPGTQGT